MVTQQADALIGLKRLEAECLALPVEHRKHIYRVLLESINPQEQYSSTRGTELLKAMEAVLGEDIPIWSRIHRHVWGRACVVLQLYREGYTTDAIALMMGKTRATVIYLANKMRDALDMPASYYREVDWWHQFQEKLKTDKI